MTSSRPAQIRPLDTLWQARVILWVVLAGEALALVLALAPGMQGDRVAYFGLASLAIQWVALMALGMLYLLRHWLASKGPLFIAQVALAALLLSTWMVSTLAWWTLHDVLLVPRQDWAVFAIRVTAVALTVGLLALATFQNHWRTRQLAVRAKQAELEALQARLRPHFLFNTLNTGLALLHTRPEQAERLLLDLSDLFRAALAGPAQVALAEELSLARRYLEIESLRFGERLDVRWELPADTAMPQVMLPTLSIQPLVENAIRHGIEPDVSGGYVVVGVGAEAGMVTVTVRNSLPANAVMFSNGHKVGLSAVRARIEAFTGGEGRVETTCSDAEFVATLTVPVARPTS